jgi:hypothetical protein
VRASRTTASCNGIFLFQLSCFSVQQRCVVTHGCGTPFLSVTLSAHVIFDFMVARWPALSELVLAVQPV